MPKIRFIFVTILLIFSILFYIVVEKKFTYNFVDRFINLTENLLPSKVDEIVLAKKKGKDWQKWIIKKTKNGWIIDYKYPRPANVKKIKEILSSFRNIKGEVRAKDESTWSVFYLRKEQALHIFFKNKNKLIAHFLVGKKGPSFDTCFVRLPDSPEVYLVNKNILTIFKIFSKEPKFPKPDIFLELFTEWDIVNPNFKKLSELDFNFLNYKWKLKISQGVSRFNDYNGNNIEITNETLIKFLKKFFPIVSQEIIDPDLMKNKKSEGKFILKFKKGPLLKMEVFLVRNQRRIIIKKGPFYYLLTKESQNRLLNPFKIFSSIQAQSENDNLHQAESHKDSDR